jgi:hypothetical protein
MENNLGECTRTSKCVHDLDDFENLEEKEDKE